MPSVRLQEINRIYLGKPYTHCISTLLMKNSFNHTSKQGHDTYDPTKCNAKRLHTKIYQTCNCILRYISDIEEYFDDYNFNDYRIVSKE